MLKKIIKKIAIMIIFLLLIFSTDRTFARNAKFYSKPVEGFNGVLLDEDDQPFLYRTFTSAAPYTQRVYNHSDNACKHNWLKKASDGWVYVQKAPLGFGSLGQNIKYLVINNDGHGNLDVPGSGTATDTFRSWSTYFHPSENTYYSGSGSMKYKVYTSNADPETWNVSISTQPGANVKTIISERAEYKGIWDAPEVYGNKGSLIPDDGSRYANGILEILEDQNFMWRMRVSGDTYVSDMLISPQHYQWLYGLFSNQMNSGNPIYVSSNVYSKGGKKIQSGMDTAYKFYDNLRWWGETKSNTFTGSPGGINSFINYYDNLIYFPKPEETTIYVRHIDVTGDAVITKEIVNTKCYTSKFKKVGFGKINANTDNISIFPTYDTNYPEYQEKFLISNEIDHSDVVTIYNKLYSEITRTRTDGHVQVDDTDYTGYSLVGTVVGVGNDIGEAMQNRNDKYGTGLTKEQLNQTVRETVDVFGVDYGNFIVIDFLYQKEDGGGSPPPNPNNTKLLVRHINVSGMAYGDYSIMNNLMNTGTIGTNIFNGYNSITQGSSSIGVNQSGRVKYNGVGNNYNEIYLNLSPNTNYTVYNEFYNNPDSDYEYIGYITSSNKYALAVAELGRNFKIDDIDFSDLDTLDGIAGSGSVNINTGEAEFILVDMYYKEKDTEPIKFADVSGRLSFDSVLDDFSDKTEYYYDIIPSDEDMYASITNANKYILGGIRILPLNIQSTQNVQITVNVPYQYTFTYWADTECSEGHGASSSEVGDDCDTLIYCDCEEPCECEPEECGASIDKVIVTKTVYPTLTRTFNYEIPYVYDYYKVSNMRVYKIDHMVLDDTENTTDLPLFDGGVHKIGTTTSYTNSVKGSFTSSANSQVLQDSRGSIVNISTPTASNTTARELQETVTVERVVFPEKNVTYEDEEYTEAEASQLFYNDYVKTHIDSIDGRINSATAATITNAYTDGTIDTVNDVSQGARVKFTVSNDKIKVGTADMLAKTSAAREVTQTINISDFVFINGYSPYTMSLKTTYPDNVRKQYGFGNTTDLTTSQSDFNKDELNIPMERLNGERISKARLYYKLLSDGAVNFDVSNTTAKHDWTRTAATASGQSFRDTEMNSNGTEIIETRITPGANLPETMNYLYESSKTSFGHGTGDVVNVFTPIKFNVSLKNDQTSSNPVIVDHTTGHTIVSQSTERIQKDTRFTITIKPENSHGDYGHLDNGIEKYIDSYYIKFENLDVQEILINESSYLGGSSVPAGTWIGPIENKGNNTKISAITRENPNDAVSVLNQESNTYVVRGVTKNATYSMHDDLLSGDYPNSLITKSSVYMKAENIYATSSSDNTLYHTDYYFKRKLYNDNDFVAETTSVETKNLGRVHDFKVTDVKDLDWKDTFRKSTTTNTNKHSGIVYYSGVNKWDIYTTTFNKRIRRTVDEIGATSQRTLPVGPYKNTNTSYIYAPKLGYRFSFDFKTTGQVTSYGKTAKIKVSYMFIDKSKGLDPSDRLIEDIDLYYKNSSNKYVKLEDSSDKLYFVPNDGYRLTFMESTYNFDTDTLSDKTVKLGTYKELNLNSKMRAISDNNYNQIWYGEFKLPNSTIAVMKDEVDLNKKLTNGYIAVKFDIEVTDKYSDGSNITIRYGQNDKAAVNQTNTSQWDYEGYLGFNNPGHEATGLTLRLDTGVVWNINNDIYNKLKGTVMLYDASAKASSDYE